MTITESTVHSVHKSTDLHPEILAFVQKHGLEDRLRQDEQMWETLFPAFRTYASRIRRLTGNATLAKSFVEAMNAGYDLGEVLDDRCPEYLVDPAVMSWTCKADGKHPVIMFVDDVRNYALTDPTEGLSVSDVHTGTGCGKDRCPVGDKYFRWSVLDESGDTELSHDYQSWQRHHQWKALQEDPWHVIKLRRLLGKNQADWLIPGFMERGKLAALFGRPKAGKSLYALEQALKLVSTEHTVLYMDEENDLPEVYERALSMGYDLTESMEGQLIYKSFTDFCVDDEDGAKGIVELAIKNEADLVILDSYAKFFKNGSQNDDRAINEAYRLTLKPLKKAGIAVLRLDHTGHENQERAAGSVQKIADVDHNWQMAKSEKDGVVMVTLSQKDNRTGRGEDTIALKRVTSPNLAHVPFSARGEEIDGSDDDEKARNLASEMLRLGIDLEMSLDRITDALKVAGIATTRRAIVSSARRAAQQR